MNAKVKEKPQIETLQLKVGGMSCSFCAESIRKAVRRQPGLGRCGRDANLKANGVGNSVERGRHICAQTDAGAFSWPVARRAAFFVALTGSREF